MRILIEENSLSGVINFDISKSFSVAELNDVFTISESGEIHEFLEVVNLHSLVSFSKSLDNSNDDSLFDEVSVSTNFLTCCKLLKELWSSFNNLERLIFFLKQIVHSLSNFATIGKNVLHVDFIVESFS